MSAHSSPSAKGHTLSIADVEKILGPPAASHTVKPHTTHHRPSSPSQTPYRTPYRTPSPSRMAARTPSQVLVSPHVRTRSKAAHSFDDLRSILKDYHRITVHEACNLIAHDNLDVWTGSDDAYVQVDQHIVRAQIQRARQNQKSFCNMFLKDNLGFSDDMYAREKDRWKDLNLSSLVGIYHGNRSNRIVIVFHNERLGSKR